MNIYLRCCKPRFATARRKLAVSACSNGYSHQANSVCLEHVIILLKRAQVLVVEVLVNVREKNFHMTIAPPKWVCKVDSSGETWDFPRRRHCDQASVGQSSVSDKVGNSSRHADFR